MGDLLNIIRWLVNHFWGGIIFIIIGIMAFQIALKNPQMRESPFRGDIGGRVAGVGSIIIGIIIILRSIFR
jgi:hypothetical protein